MVNRFTALFPAALAIALASAGCAVEQHRSIVPGKNQTVEVASGDRWYFDLEEDAGVDGARWDAVCDDGDVEVTVDHTDHLAGPAAERKSVAKVRVRIHRGYDGPSTVRFRLKRRGERRVLKEFTLGLFKRCGDEAFWK